MLWSLCEVRFLNCSLPFESLTSLCMHQTSASQVFVIELVWILLVHATDKPSPGRLSHRIVHKFLFFVMLEPEPRASCITGKHSAELQTNPLL